MVEFHSVYCWRTRRLLAEKDLSLLQLMQDGNLGKVCTIMTMLIELFLSAGYYSRAFENIEISLILFQNL